jgi:hypothetical protein
MGGKTSKIGGKRQKKGKLTRVPNMRPFAPHVIDEEHDRYIYARTPCSHASLAAWGRCRRRWYSGRKACNDACEVVLGMIVKDVGTVAW